MIVDLNRLPKSLSTKTLLAEAKLGYLKFKY